MKSVYVHIYRVVGSTVVALKEKHPFCAWELLLPPGPPPPRWASQVTEDGAEKTAPKWSRTSSLGSAPKAQNPRTSLHWIRTQLSAPVSLRHARAQGPACPSQAGHTWRPQVATIFLPLCFESSQVSHFPVLAASLCGCFPRLTHRCPTQMAKRWPRRCPLPQVNSNEILFTDAPAHLGVLCKDSRARNRLEFQIWK